MSRTLPKRPNLEHLKNQAKARLDALLHHDPNAKLADALHAIAGEYGFASWPKLKAHVLQALGAATTTASASSFAGQWKANYAKSKRSPLDDSQSAILEFTVVGDTVTILDVTLDAAGIERRGINSLEADGNEYVSEAGHGYSVRAMWDGPHTLDVSMKHDGVHVGSVRYSVASDSGTLTVGAESIAHNEYPATAHLVVFDRVGH
jgi:hypothetical protein